MPGLRPTPRAPRTTPTQHQLKPQGRRPPGRAGPMARTTTGRIDRHQPPTVGHHRRTRLVDVHLRRRHRVLPGHSKRRAHPGFRRAVGAPARLSVGTCHQTSSAHMRVVHRGPADCTARPGIGHTTRSEAQGNWGQPSRSLTRAGPRRRGPSLGAGHSMPRPSPRSTAPTSRGQGITPAQRSHFTNRAPRIRETTHGPGQRAATSP